MDDAIVIAVALAFAGMGLAAFLNPRAVPDQFGVAAETVEGRNEVQAVYGGFGLAIAGVLAFVAFDDPAIGEGVLGTVAVSLAGMAAGRLIAAVRERPTGLYPVWVFFAFEVVAAAALLAVA